MTMSGQLDRAEQGDARPAGGKRAAARQGQAQHAKAGPARTRSIGSTLVGLLLIPLLALVGLWGYLAATTLGNAFFERSENQLVSGTTLSTYVLLGTIEEERTQAYLWLSSPHRPPVSKLAVSRQTVNSAIAAQRGTNGFAGLAQRRDVVTALARIPGIRSGVDDGKLSPTAAFQAYSGVVDQLFTVFTTDDQSDNTLYQHTLGAIYAGQALEQFSREVAVMTAAQANHDQLNPADIMLFSEAVGNQNLLVGDALAVGDPTLQGSLRSLYGSPLHTQIASLESQFASSHGQAIPARTMTTWTQLAGAFETKMTGLTTGDAGPLGSEAGQVSNRLFIQAGLVGGLGLLAVLLSVFLMIRVGRTIRRELKGLHDGAEAMASERLPRVIERLRQGDEVDVAEESPPLVAGKITEVARVAEAFSAVQHTAVDAAVSQSNLRKAINQVFLNLSLRNQSLLHRQLGMLDTMERATSDPAALDELFKLDHLTTRMRRHAENLIILSGSTPGRRWRDPVPVLDVLSAATAEVEDYVRVDAMSASSHSVSGAAVNDVVHLIAELVENATSFSPPNSRVEVKADEVGFGVAVEIEDRGLGITSDERAEINARLASPPEFDLTNADQLGLFVVGQLAVRHGIKVSLRESAFGGTTAIALLPHAILVTAEEAARPPALERGQQRQARAIGPPPARESADGPGNGPGNGSAGWPAIAAADAPTGNLTPARDPAPDLTPSPAAALAPAETRDLPRRVRQASLAPQLRGRGDGAAEAARPASAAAERSPEEARSMMSSLQDGARRGRVDDLDPADRRGDPGARSDPARSDPGARGGRPGDSPGGVSVWDARRGGSS
jgi:signal transduction histidine kinase